MKAGCVSQESQLYFKNIPACSCFSLNGEKWGYFWYFRFYLLLFLSSCKDMFVDFREKEKERERKRERECDRET